MPHSQDHAWKWREWIFALGLIATVFLAYAPAWHGGFLWDDDGHITRADLRSIEGLGRIWTEPGATQQYYPVLHTAFWLEHRVFGDRPTGYHFVNLVLHGLNVLLLLAVLRRLRLRRAWLAAGIFALHPVMVESVAWITELKNTLSGAFYFGAALAYLRFDAERRGRWYALALGLFILALGSKTVTATLPGALLVIFWWQRGALAWRRDAWPLVPFFALGAVSGLFTGWVELKLIGASGAEFGQTLVERGLIAGRVIWFYLGKLVWPADLVFIYERWPISQREAWQYLYPLAALVTLAALWWLRRRSRGPLAGALIFTGTLFPVLGFFNVYPFQFSFVADHFQYLASLGVIVPVAAGLAAFGDRVGPRPVAFAGAALLLGLGILTYRQSRIYRDAETLYRATIARNPACWLAYSNLGMVVQQRRAYDEAITLYETALKLRPQDVTTYYNLGSALAVQRRLPAAVEALKTAVRLRPSYAKAHHNLGNALAELGRLAEAEIHFATAVRLRPDFTAARRSLGFVQLDNGRPAEAARQLVEVLKVNPRDAEVQAALEALAKAGYRAAP